jgi:hypothetical protein
MYIDPDGVQDCAGIRLMLLLTLLGIWMWYILICNRMYMNVLSMYAFFQHARREYQDGGQSDQ